LVFVKTETLTKSKEVINSQKGGKKHKGLKNNKKFEKLQKGFDNKKATEDRKSNEFVTQKQQVAMLL
jgi:hypothetical protein